MKFFVAFVLAMAVAVANAQAGVQPYVVPIYRVTMDSSTSTSTSTGSTATTTTPTTTAATTTSATTTAATTTAATTTAATTTAATTTAATTTAATTTAATTTAATTTAATTTAATTTAATTTAATTTAATTTAATTTAATTTAATTTAATTTAATTTAATTTAATTTAATTTAPTTTAATTTAATTTAATTTAATTTAATTTAATTTAATTTAATTTAATTTAATTTAPTTTAATTTAATTAATTTIADTSFFNNFAHFFEAKHIRHPRSLIVNPKGIPDHTFTHVCSGTLVDNSAIITTITCIELATENTEMNAYVGTAADDSSEDSASKAVYEVISIHKHPNYDAATNTNNIAVLKLRNDVDFSLSDKVQHTTWSLEVPKVDTKCVTSYWGSVTPFHQMNENTTVKACSPLKNGTICSTYPTTYPTTCPAGANGASLVCDDKIAGLFSAKLNSACTTMMWQYEELSKDSTWIWESVNAAPILNVSFAAILALITAMIKSL